MPRFGPSQKRGRDHGLLFNASALLLCGLLAGVVVAAALFPAVALPGLVAKAGADQFDNLPTVLNMPQLPQITYVYASDGTTLISTFYDENRRYVPLAQVAPVMREALVAAEDIRFYQHHGVDIKSVARAWVVNQQSGETAQGASTLTMQYVRLALEYSASTPQESVDATADTTARKLREMRLALAVEKQLTKDQILERYLTLAPFGNGAYGIYAAAETYFGVTPAQLTLGQATLLAALVKAPTSYDPMSADGYKLAMDRRDNHVLTNMVKMGYIGETARQQVLKQQLKLTGKSTPNGCVSVMKNSWGFFCDYFYRWWLQQPAFGADQFERDRRLKSGGYTIVTSLDVKAQATAKKYVERYDPTGDNPTALMLAGVVPGTGRIDVLATNRNFSNDQSHNRQSTNPDRHGQKGNWPNTTNPLLSGGGDIAGYQFGSSFKVFTMVAALQQGYQLDYAINATSPYVSKYIVDAGSPAACQGDHYCPVNANPSWMNGRRNMWTGLGRSVNTYWVPLEERVGAQNAVNAAKALGIKFRAKQDADYANNADQWGAFTLGVSATTPLDMANAYATLAADGKYCDPLPVVSIKDLQGTSLDVSTPHCHQAVSADVAHAAIDAMRCPIGDQSAYAQCDGATAGNVRDIVGKPLAGKTGTTDSNQTAALILTTRQQALAGVVGDPDWPTTSMLQYDLGGRDPHAGVVNVAVAYTMRDIMAGKPGQDWPGPPRSLAFGGRGDPAAQPTPQGNPLGGGGFPLPLPTIPGRRH